MQEYEQTKELLNRSVKLDPKFVRAYNFLSSLHSWLYFSVDHTEKHLTLAKEALDKALLLEPESPSVHLTAAYYYYRGFLDYGRALQEYDFVKRVLPNYHDATPGFFLRRQGKLEQSTSIFEESFKYNPRDYELAYEIGLNYLRQRQHEQAIAWFDRSLSIAPDYKDAKTTKVWTYIEWEGGTTEARAILETMDRADVHDIWRAVFTFERKYQQALKEIDSIRESFSEGQIGIYQKNLDYAGMYFLMGDSAAMKVQAGSTRRILEEKLRFRPSEPKLCAALGYAYAYLGRRDEAIENGKLATELLPVSKDAVSGPNYVEDFARIYTIIGEKAEAIKLLDYLLSIPHEISVPLIRIDPIWDGLRDDSQFKKLIGEK